jgi:hypothetical protein
MIFGIIILISLAILLSGEKNSPSILQAPVSIDPVVSSPIIVSAPAVSNAPQAVITGGILPSLLGNGSPSIFKLGSPGPGVSTPGVPHVLLATE